MARWTWYMLVLGVAASCTASVCAQVGPPMGDGLALPARPHTLESTTIAEPRASGERAALPDESSMPLMVPVQSGAPEEDAAASSSGGWLRSVASVGLVVGLILVLAAATRFVSRRSGSVAATIGPGGRAPSGVLEVLARYPVGRGQTLVLLRIDRRILLLSQSTSSKGSGFVTLAQFDEPSEVAAILRQTQDEASESISARFRQAMDRFQSHESNIERGEIIEVGPKGEPLRSGRGLWA